MLARICLSIESHSQVSIISTVISACFYGLIFIYLDDVYDLTVFRPLPRRVVQHEPLHVWYLGDDRTLLVSHPLAISSVLSFMAICMLTVSQDGCHYAGES